MRVLRTVTGYGIYLYPLLVLGDCRYYRRMVFHGLARWLLEYRICFFLPASGEP